MWYTRSSPRLVFFTLSIYSLEPTGEVKSKRSRNVAPKTMNRVSGDNEIHAMEEVWEYVG